MDIFLVKIKQARKLLKMSQAQMAEAVGLAQKDVSNIESGVRQYIPNQYISFLYKNGIDIVGLFNPDVEDLMHRTKPIVENESPYLKPVPKSVPISKRKKLGTDNLADSPPPDYPPPDKELTLLYQLLENREQTINALQREIKSHLKTIELLEEKLAFIARHTVTQTGSVVT